MSTPSGLKLSDCEKRAVGAANGQPYAALSYEWGKQVSVVSLSTKLPNTLPNTIEDAIAVVQKLGFRFLWVDRFYINQNDAQEVLHQVAQMDIIYRHVEFTIIAACGSDPNHGLPGVGSRSRPFKKEKVLGSWIFSEISTLPRKAVGSSCWNSRGWTYQEALFSRRRLVFMDEQVLFECWTLTWLESSTVAYSHNDYPSHDLIDLHMTPGKTYTRPRLEESSESIVCSWIFCQFYRYSKSCTWCDSLAGTTFVIPAMLGYANVPQSYNSSLPNGR
jgi:heterokaryon incompatibility protein (HET)